MKNLIIGTAGHIDHGKTSLIKALTGVDTDRLAEEKERGITIDIGFAHLQLSDFRIGFIDVPGHERFVKNMLAGIGGIQLVMLVVASDESVMPQTIEHFQICKLLNIQRGIVVLTKSDHADEEIIELVKEEVRELVKDSFLEEAPFCPVDSVSGRGIEELKLTIEKLVLDMEKEGLLELSDEEVFRLSVDRVFTVKGFGTVVTGTAHSGNLKKDSTVEIHPTGKIAKVRGIQIFGENTESAHSGQRTAINLTSVEKDELFRGATISTPRQLKPTQIIDAQIELLSGAPTPLRYRSPIRFHHGSCELIGRIYLLGNEELQPGGRGLAQIRLDSPTICIPGDRFILRRYSPLTTVGGGIILDNSPVKHKKKDLSNLLPGLQEIHQIISAGGSALHLEVLLFFINLSGIHGLDIEALVSRTGTNAPRILERLASADSVVVTTKEPPRFVIKTHVQASGLRLTELLRSTLSKKPLSPGISKGEIKEKLFKDSGQAHYQALLNWYTDQGIVAIREEFINLPGRQVSLNENQEEIRLKILSFVQKQQFQPCSLKDFNKMGAGNDIREVYFHLIRSGELVKISEDLVFSPELLKKLTDRLQTRFSGEQGFSVPDFKDLFGLSRKYAIPILEYLDRSRFTRRVGERRQLTNDN